MKKLFAFLITVVLLLSMAGCGISEREASRRIKRYIKEKYGRGYEFSEVYTGQSGGGMFGGVTWYKVTVTHKKTGVSFTARCDSLGGSMQDHYAQALYNDALAQKLESVFASYPDFCFQNLDIQWSQSPDDWRPTVPFEEFFAETDTIEITADLTIPETGAEQRTEEFLQLFRTLEADNNTVEFTVYTDAEDSRAYIKILPEHQYDPEAIGADLQYLGEFIRDERRFKDIVNTYSEEHPFLKLDDQRANWYRNNTHQFSVDVIMSEEDPAGKTEELLELIQLLDSEGFNYWLYIRNTQQLSTTEYNRKHILIADGEVTDPEYLRQQLQELDFTPEPETEPTGETQNTEETVSEENS